MQSKKGKGLVVILLLLVSTFIISACGNTTNENIGYQNDDTSTPYTIEEDPQQTYTAPTDNYIPTIQPTPEPSPTAPTRGTGTLFEAIDTAIQNATLHGQYESEFDIQLARLHEFATNLNRGSVALSDIIVTRIWGHPEGHVMPDPITGLDIRILFDVGFFHTSTLHDEYLIEELLEFTGINRDDISFFAYPQVIPFVFYEFLLVNTTINEFAQPHLRIKEFARNINSDTITYDEALITVFWDMGQFVDLLQGGVMQPRFTIGLAVPELKYDANFISELLSFTGVSLDDIEFQQTDVGSHYIEFDFLHVNAELGELAQQWERLVQFSNLTTIRTIRRDIPMENLINFIAPASVGMDTIIGADGRVIWDASRFQVGFADKGYLTEDFLIDLMLEFTGIARDRIYLTSGDTSGWQISPRDLNAEQRIIFELLDDFMETVNAPFWQDRHAHDPVIVKIDLPTPEMWAWAMPEDEVSNHFTIWLYDLENLEAVSAEIISFTGINPVYLDIRVI